MMVRGWAWAAMMADRGLWCVRGGEGVLGGYERRVWVMVVVGGGGGLL